MTLSLILFYASFLGIIAMMAYKSFELRTNKRTFFTYLTEKTDHKVHAFFYKGRTFISYFNRKSAVALIQWIAYHVLSWARNAYIHMHKKAHAHPPSKKVLDMVRGKVNLGREGGASFFLKHIGEEGKNSQGMAGMVK